MNIIGTSRPIHDAEGKARGQANYAGDMRLKGMVYAALITSTVANGYVRSMDLSEAEKVEGYLGSLTCLEDHGKPYCRYRSLKGQNTADQEYVFNRRVRLVGDRIGCVLADSLESARKAARRVKVDYEVYPAAFTAQETLSGIAGTIHEEGNTSEEICVEEGKLPAGEFISVETQMHLSRVNHVTMEPHVCTADYDPASKQLTIYSPNQTVHGVRTVIADIFSLPYGNVRVVKSTMGGSFGTKQEWVAEPVAAAAALYRKGPVQLVLSREEVFTSTICRAPMDIQVKGLYTPDGQLMSMQADNTLDAGAYLGNSKDYCGAMANKFFRCYHYPHMKYTGRAVITNTPVSGAFRGWTSPELALFFEHNLNMAARRLGIDPLELRLKNVAHPGDIDIRINEPLGPIRIQECLEKGRALFHWDKRRAEDAAFNAPRGRYRRGCAVACGGHLNGYYPRVIDFASAEMRVAEDGGVLVNMTLHDHGCGTVEAFRMMIAEALSLQPEQIFLGEGDTALTPFDPGCFSSRTTFVLGQTALLCAQGLIEKLKDAVCDLYDVSAASLSAKDGTLTDGKNSWSYAQIVQDCHRQLQREVFASYQFKNTTNPGVTDAHFAHVEVDVYTGNVKILDYLAVHDIGRAINPEICRAQIQGAVQMGAGAALNEQMTIDKRGCATHSLGKYHILNAPQAPSVRVEFIEDGGTNGPFGCKSIGEVCHVPPAAVIVGAVNEALHADLDTIPLNQDAICRWVESHQEEVFS